MTVRLTFPMLPVVRSQRGVGMVELMVAMLLGALVIIGVIQVFTANKQTFRMQDAMALTQETGTFALDFISRDLLRAGYPGFPSSTDAFDWDATVNGVAGGNDSLAVVYGPDAAGGVYCTGEPTGAALRISNRYWVDDGELKCQGAAQNEDTGIYEAVGSEQVLADNVESFQVLFGVDLVWDRNPVLEPAPGGFCADSPQAPTAYVVADEVKDPVAGALVRGATPAVCGPFNFAEMDPLEVVRSVRIALLMSTPNTTDVVVPASRTYTVLDERLGNGVIVNSDDGKLRRLFTKTISLRNVGETIE